MDPVDELASVRAEIARLKQREDELRAGFLLPGARLRSNQHEVVVRHGRRRVFVKDRLPKHILDDPAYWDERSSTVITLRALDGGGRAGRRRDPDDDLTLIEQA